MTEVGFKCLKFNAYYKKYLKMKNSKFYQWTTKI